MLDPVPPFAADERNEHRRRRAQRPHTIKRKDHQTLQNAVKEFERALTAHDRVLRNHYRRRGSSQDIIKRESLSDNNFGYLGNSYSFPCNIKHMAVTTVFYYKTSINTQDAHRQIGCDSLQSRVVKSDVIFQIIMCKRQARAALVLEQAIRDYRRTLRRERSRLEHLPIRHKRIPELEEQIEYITETLFRPVRAFLAWNGGLLLDLFDQAEEMGLSLQDKAGILGVSHEHLQNLIDEECEDTNAASRPNLCEMVVVHHAEHRFIRENESFMPTGPETPLFSALMANVMELMRSNEEARETISGGITRVLAEEAEKSRLRIVRKQ